ncbi:nucleotidyltransferase substrate binding protein [Natronoflexus pectinivorans]|uniref:Nucleotidyltransferase substrate binding protein (TIGR01987 family) n=1 Tax=Natronoflexus pectinivorans TaxID=682526 RepID=A0A4R2GFW9_9BACT|nr:nucleotidyltransferase substrate binding protein [Natronoflexus pectinivorans]TCO06910.1 nucleotidyltransferase substrate binding protein (TIGR01987 family) [Natronoflexus pectinivorans]
MNTDIRWKQRFENFEKAFRQLNASLRISDPNETELAGIIQFYEITLELAWKTLKDFLVLEGFDVKSPREAIKTAFQNGYISKGEIWIDALDSRNLSVHTYDEEMANQLTENIRNVYYPILDAFMQWGQQQKNK